VFCASLQALYLRVCRGLTDVSALAGCASLQTLDLSGGGGLTDVSALAGCASLQSLVGRGGAMFTTFSSGRFTGTPSTTTSSVESVASRGESTLKAFACAI